MNDNILSLFEGLTKQEARQFRREILSTLRSLRSKIITESYKQEQNKQRLQNEMQSENEHREAVQDAIVEG